MTRRATDCGAGSRPALWRRGRVQALVVAGVLAVAFAVDRSGRHSLLHRMRHWAHEGLARSERWFEPRTPSKPPAAAHPGAGTATQAAFPTPPPPSEGFQVFARSTLLRIGPRDAPGPGESDPRIRLEATWGDYEPAQLAVHALQALASLRVVASDLQGPDGAVLPASSIDVRMERFYALQLSLRQRNRSGVVPKTLEPAAAVPAAAGSTRPWWVTVHVPRGLPGGLYRGNLKVVADTGTTFVPLEVDVLPLALDEAPRLLGPISLPVLRNYTRANAERREVLRQRADAVFADIREHGMTTLGLWSGDEPERRDGSLVLPDLDVAMQLFRDHGFPQPLLYSPVNLLKTNKLGTSASYRHHQAEEAAVLAREIAATYVPRAAALGLPGLILDPIEEPNYGDGIDRKDDPAVRQRMAASMLAALKSGGATTSMTCTPETAALGQGNLDWWVVAYKKFTPSVIAAARRSGAHPAMYANTALMGNGTSFSRFFFGYFPWAVGLDGMLSWTYPMTPQRFPVNLDPKLAEGPGNVHDGILGSDDRPVPTIQWELAREGVDDARYVATLERMAAAARTSPDPEARRLAAEAADFLASLRAGISPDAHRYDFEDADTLELDDAPGWSWQDFEARRHRSFELLRALSDKAFASGR